MAKSEKILKAIKHLDSKFRKATQRKGYVAEDKAVAACSFCAGLTAMSELHQLKLTKTEWNEVFSNLVKVLEKYDF